MTEKENPLETMDAAAEVVEQSQQTASPNVTLSNGVIIACRKVPIMTLRHAYASLPKPKPPIIRNEDKDRNEEWEGDPQYIQDLADWEEKIGDVGANIMLSLGTKILDIPEGVDKVEDEGWIQTLEAIGIEVKTTNPIVRYLSWLRFYAITTPNDLLTITTVIAKMSGVLEKDVQTSLESFRDREPGGTDPEISAEERGGDGDSIPRTNGRSHLRDGGEG